MLGCEQQCKAAQANHTQMQDDMGELGLLILEKAYGRFDTGRPASLDKLQFTQVLSARPCQCMTACHAYARAVTTLMWQGKHILKFQDASVQDVPCMLS